MGFISDKLQDAVQSKVEESIENSMENAGAERRKKDSVIARFFVSLLWLIINIGITAFVLYMFFRTMNDDALIYGIVASAIFIIITVAVPYTRRGSWTRWFGLWLPLGDIAWWVYLLMGN